MKLLLDFFPLLIFFIAYKFWGIYAATQVAIAASVLQIIYMRVRRQPIKAMHWFSFGAIVLLGGATLLTQNETFIKWKPTVVFWLMGTALWLGQSVFGKNLLHAMMSEAQLDLPDAVWRAMTWHWVIFFAIMGALNLYVAYHFGTDTWASFKVFGSTGLMFAFIVGQGLYMARFITAAEKAAPPPLPQSGEPRQPQP